MSNKVSASTKAQLLPYASATELLHAVRHLPDPILLDSCHPSDNAGRFSIACATPTEVLEIHSAAELLLLEKLRQPLPPLTAPEIQHLPFTGGWMGYWSYDAGRLFEQLPQQAEDDLALPLIRMGLYPWALVTDHQLQQTWLVGSFNPELAEQLLQHLQASPIQVADEADFQLTNPFVSNLSHQAYLEHFEQVQAWLRSGDAYQVNLAQRFTASYKGSLYQAWQQLRSDINAPWAAFMQWQDKALLSLSPERFLLAEPDGRVETRPIKGTRPRGQTPEEDQHYRDELLHSAKDRAENLMIVDLLRNDLGRVCEPGSIRVPQLFALESHTNVHHLVSHVTGQLAPGKHPLDLLQACFPGGSITGAPKLRAMEIIETLEPCRRSIYCGSIGYLDRSGRMDFNIAIRTFIASDNQLHVWGGGGLVADSDGQTEYEETFHKVSWLIRCLQPTFPD
ncbi:aminodeoxychorismate synthase component I [Marinospirillum alkaliphilum]|uniref:aminodeoxychorismate synthase n=1 Tax=Marinospirillum alkaliphilum DSM 21637 TaxID=1122209 RepID=A0A1K1TEG3_9GAMM|nr:aminodeoxychorismate synthase component I [Marinospirillum alkaliphilum]SFW98952.1 para-aminobenzoate synthetase component 1 [Marinospirillum alkaliphilum DSM 21637]